MSIISLSIQWPTRAGSGRISSLDILRAPSTVGKHIHLGPRKHQFGFCQMLNMQHSGRHCLSSVRLGHNAMRRIRCEEKDWETRSVSSGSAMEGAVTTATTNVRERASIPMSGFLFESGSDSIWDTEHISPASSKFPCFLLFSGPAKPIQYVHQPSIL